MLHLACERCGKRYVLRDVPEGVPGRSYRLTCKACGHSFALKIGEGVAPAREPTPAPLPEHPQATTLDTLKDPGSARDTPVADAPSPPSPSAPPADGGYVELFSDGDLLDSPPVSSPSSRREEPAVAADDPFAHLAAHRAPLEPEPEPTAPSVAEGSPDAPSTSPDRLPERHGDLHLLRLIAAGCVVLLLGVGAIALWRGKAQGTDHPSPTPAPEPAAAAPPGSTAPAPTTPPPTAAEPQSPAAPTETAAAPPAPVPSPTPGSTPDPQVAAQEPTPDEPKVAPGPTRPPSRPAKAPARPAKRPAVAQRGPAEKSPPAAAGAPAAAAPSEPASTPEPALPENLSAEEVQRALGSGRKTFDACLKNPSRGVDQPFGARQVTLRFVVAPNGSVNYTTIDDVAISSAPVGQCLKTAARGLLFPPFSGDPLKVDLPIQIPER